jgi:hypothetical protein
MVDVGLVGVIEEVGEGLGDGLEQAYMNTGKKHTISITDSINIRLSVFIFSPLIKIRFPLRLSANFSHFNATLAK